MMNTIKRLVLEEEGQGMAEYALILVFIAIACIGAFTFLGGKVGNKVNEVGNGLN
jgi:pilus assembly protein Flp/PilA